MLHHSHPDAVPHPTPPVVQLVLVVEAGGGHLQGQVDAVVGPNGGTQREAAHHPQPRRGAEHQRPLRQGRQREAVRQGGSAWRQHTDVRQWSVWPQRR